MDMQVKEVGESESLLVIDKIGLVKTRDTQLERVQNSDRSQMTRKLVRSQRIVASDGA